MKSIEKFLLFLIEGSFLGCTFTPKVADTEYLIEGKLRNIPDSTVIRLYKEEGSILKNIHSDTVFNGKFSFKDTLYGTTPQKLVLLSSDSGFPGRWLDLYVQAGQYIQIKGADRLLPLWEVDSNVKEQQASNAFMALCPSERKKSMQLAVQEYDLLRNKQQKIDWKKVDSIRLLRQPLDSIIQVAELNYMKEAPITTVWLDQYKRFCAILQYNPGYSHCNLIRSLYSRMSESDKATETGKEITEYMNLPQPINVGDEMADGDLYDVNGELHHLSELKGKYILLDFWSQGCGPCVQSIPEMEEITERYKSKMNVVSICEDTKDNWISYIQTKHLKGNQWNELRKGNTGLAAAYQVKGIPHYVMISPEGKVIQMWSGYGQGSLKSRMKELIK